MTTDEKTTLHNSEEILQAINQLISAYGGNPSSLAGELTSQMIQNSLRVMGEGHDIGQMKLMTRALKEMRHAYKIFNQYRDTRRISIFGSARTPEHHPDYQAAKAFSIVMADLGWMCITGAADGIMKAGLEGSKKHASFGLSIRLPFEIPTNSVIEGDSKLMMFKYFFTRKLMFMSHADAVAVFPGGFGTQDELFEVLTLMHTGKSSIIPLVLMEGQKGTYWQHWKQYVDHNLLDNKMISPEDEHLYYFSPSPEDAAQHIQQFYHRYHSSRYVKDQLVLRLTKSLQPADLKKLNHRFAKLVQTGEMIQGNALEEEKEYLELPRLMFHHTRKDFGLLRALIDEVNKMS